jgi:cell division protein FtsB
MKTTLERARAALPPNGPPPRRLLIVVGAFAAAVVIAIPARQLVAQQAHLAQLEGRVARLQAENQMLETTVRQLQDPAMLELEARERLGRVRPGEQSYVFVPGPTPPAPPAEAVEDDRSALSRFWGWLGRLIRGSG